MTQSRAKVQITFADVDDLPIGEPQMEVRTTWWAAAIGLAVIAYVAIIPSLAGGFLPLDDVNVRENVFLRATSGLRAIWRFCYTDLFQQFSPLGYSVYLLEYKIWGRVARHLIIGGRQINVLLHISNVLLLWTLLRKLDLRGAFVAAAIFAAHPVQVQTVAWISQQPMLLGVGLALSSLIVFMRFTGINPAPYQRARFGLPENRIVLYSLAMGLFCLSLLAKPALAVLPLAMLAMIWWERGKVTRDDLKALAPFFAMTLLAFIGAIWIFRRTPSIGEQQLSVVERVAIVGPALWFYLFELVRSGTYSFVYGKWDATAWWVWAILAADLAVIAMLWRMRGKIGRGPFVAAVIFVILLLPQILFLDLRQMRDSFVADSVMYPAVAVLIVSLVALASDWLAPRGAWASFNSPATWVGAGVIVVTTVLCMWVSTSYVSAERLWTRSIARTPNNVYALNELGMLELNRQQNLAAAAHLRRALAIDPYNIETHRHLGAYYETNSEPDRAYGEYLAVLKFRPQDVNARCGIARALAQQGDRASALVEYQRVLTLKPEYEIALNDMAMVFTELGRWDDAVRCYQRAIRSAPTYIASHINLASLYFRLGKYNEAMSSLNDAAGIDPSNFVIWINLGAMRGQLAQIVTDPKQKKDLVQGSELAFRQALYLNRDSAVAAFNLAEILAYEAEHYPAEAGKLKEAVFYYTKATQLDPENQRYLARLAEARGTLAKRG